MKKNGQIFTGELYALKILDDQGKVIGIINIIRDITERKSYEYDRDRLISELNQKNRELEEVLYVTSHDLHSPLVNIEGFSKELDYSLKELMSRMEAHATDAEFKNEVTSLEKKDIAESLNFILKSVSKMDSLLRGLLTLSCTGRVALTIENLDMDTMLAEVVSTFEYELKEKDIEVTVLKLPACKRDQRLMNQLFSNLMDNAIKYLTSERTGRVRISGSKENGKSVYCVEDNGIGIAQKHQMNIFEIFHQLEPGSTGGEGLGLTIAQGIVEMHKGSIRVEAEEGNGGRFFVAIPP